MMSIVLSFLLLAFMAWAGAALLSDIWHADDDDEEDER